MKKATKDDIRIKDIPGLEGIFGVCSCGRIWNYRKNRFQKLYVNDAGYSCLVISYKGKRTHYNVARLVAQAYIPNPENLPQVDHIHDYGDVKVNHVNNLKWCTSIINGCNRKDSIAVYDTTSGMIYCSICMAARETGCSEHKVKDSCERYLKDKKVLQHYIYLDDLTPEIVHKFYRIHPEAI